MRQPKFSRTIVWSLRSPCSRVQCIIQPRDARIELLVLQNDDVAVRDVFDNPTDARRRADGLRERLAARGWSEVYR